MESWRVERINAGVESSIGLCFVTLFFTSTVLGKLANPFFNFDFEDDLF